MLTLFKKILDTLRAIQADVIAIKEALHIVIRLLETQPPPKEPRER